MLPNGVPSPFPHLMTLSFSSMIIERMWGLMELLEYLIQISNDAVPPQEGLQAQLVYAFWNIAIPVILGVLTGAFMKMGEKILRGREKKEH